MSATFPEIAAIPEHRYYTSHIKYLIHLFLGADETIGFVHISKFGFKHVTKVEVRYQNKRLLFDFSDFNDMLPWDVLKDFDAVFKFHYDYPTQPYVNVFPFAPISFYNWKEFAQLQRTVHYTGKGYVTCRQRAYGGAKERRKIVIKMLEKQFSDFQSGRLEQVDFWKEAAKIKTAVCVPGATKRMLDRGQLQYMGFGVCTISPWIPEVLPWWIRFEGNEHYIPCAVDFSNLIYVLEHWDEDFAQAIGSMAQSTFNMSCTPYACITWIKECLK